VTSITRGEPDGVRVGLRVRPEHLGTVPDNVVARILPATVFGTSFVDLVTHGEASGTPLRAGAVIAADHTQDTLELQQALDDIDRLVKALGPAELASAIGSAATALDGRGEQLGGTIDRLDAYLGKVNPQMPLVRSDVRKLADNLELVDRVAPDLLQATDDSLVTLRTIATQEAAITAVIAGGTSLVRTADTVLDENRFDLVRYLTNAGILLGAVHDNRRTGITGAIGVNSRLGKAAKSINHRGFARADAIFQTRIPDYYTSSQRPSYGAGGAVGRTTFRSTVEGDQ
ncbi:MCE family protein, partial [Nocardioides sp.]|uniref:MCE family protein n=1 Tax=Nocardioides sp. TaxID=35761 RepID=UPI0027342396